MKILYFTGWLITRVVFTLFFRLKVSGQENIPKEGGFILAGNHKSYFDPPILGTWATRQVYFMAKQELFKNRLLGWLIRRTNALPLRRGTIDRNALENCVRVLNEGYGLTVFPEGTRARDTDFLKPKPGIGMVAVRAGCPIVPAYLENSDRLKDCFRGRCRLRLTFGPPLSSEWVQSFQATKEDYIRIAEEVMSRIKALAEKDAADS